MLEEGLLLTPTGVVVGQYLYIDGGEVAIGNTPWSLSIKGPNYTPIPGKTPSFIRSGYLLLPACPCLVNIADTTYDVLSQALRSSLVVTIHCC